MYSLSDVNLDSKSNLQLPSVTIKMNFKQALNLLKFLLSVNY